MKKDNFLKYFYKHVEIKMKIGDIVKPKIHNKHMYNNTYKFLNTKYYHDSNGRFVGIDENDVGIIIDISENNPELDKNNMYHEEKEIIVFCNGIKVVSHPNDWANL